MSYVLLANVGNRDLFVDGQPLDPQRMRAEGQALFEAAERDPRGVLSRLDAPLLRPCIDLLLERDDAEGKIELVVLYATDQRPDIAPQFRDRDTNWSARILARWLTERYRPDAGDRAARGTVEGVRVDPIADRNPANFDHMYDFFGQQFAAPEFHALSRRQYVVALAGGVPAANAMLLIRALDCFGDRVEALHKSEGLNTPTTLRIGDHLRQQMLRAPVLELLAECRFDAAAAVLQSWRNPAADSLAAAARALQAWMDFDVDGAARTLARSLRRPDDRTQPMLRRLHDAIVAAAPRVTTSADSWQPLPHAQARQILGRWYWGAHTCLQQGRRLDFVARAAGLLEALCRWVVEDALRVSTDERHERERPRLREAIEAHPILAQKFAGRERWSLNVATCLDLIGALGEEAKQSGDERRAKTLDDVAKCGRALIVVREARNRSVIGHDYVGVSDHALAEELKGRLARVGVTVEGAPGPAILVVLRRMLSALGLFPGEVSPFQAWAEDVSNAVLAIS